MAGSDKDFQQGAQQHIDNFRKSSNAVYLPRVAVIVLFSLVVSYLAYIVNTGFIFMKNGGSEYFSFSSYLSFGGYVVFMVMATIAISATFICYKVGKIIWQKSEAISTSRENESAGVDQVT